MVLKLKRLDSESIKVLKNLDAEIMMVGVGLHLERKLMRLWQDEVVYLEDRFKYVGMYEGIGMVSYIVVRRILRLGGFKDWIRETKMG